MPISTTSGGSAPLLVAALLTALALSSSLPRLLLAPGFLRALPCNLLRIRALLCSLLRVHALPRSLSPMPLAIPLSLLQQLLLCILLCVLLYTLLCLPVSQHATTTLTPTTAASLTPPDLPFAACQNMCSTPITSVSHSVSCCRGCSSAVVLIS